MIIDAVLGLHMTRKFWKNDCGRFSAVETKDGRIEILVDGEKYGNIAYHDTNFRFTKDKGRLALEMLDEIEKYIDSDGEWPDWQGAKDVPGKLYNITLEKRGHDWQRSTGWIIIKGTINGLTYKFQFGTLKALSIYCSAVDIERLVD